MRKYLKKIAIEFLALAVAFTTMPMNSYAAEKDSGMETVKTVSANDVQEEKLPVYQSEEEGEISRVFGDNNGFRWSYDESSATLTVTGEDSGLNMLMDNLPKTVLADMKNIVFRDCVVSVSMQGLLRGLDGVESVEFCNVDTSNVTDMSSMFSGCRNLVNLNISELDTGNVTTMRCMFYGCYELTSLDVSAFDTGNVTDMEYMFADCKKLQSVDVSNFDTGNVTTMGSMFANCCCLDSVDVNGFNTCNVTSVGNMFSGCSSLKNVDVSGFDTSNVTYMGYMFSECSSLEHVDVSGLDTGKVTNMDLMFSGCSSLKNVDVSGFDTSNVNRMYYMFSGCSSLKNVDVSGFDTGNVTSMAGMFYECGELNSLDVRGFDTSKVTDMSAMFYQCYSLENVDVRGFDTSKVTNMRAMFYRCYSLENVDVSGFDTGKVTNMSFMFYCDSKLSSVDVSNFDTGNVTDMSLMFGSCGFHTLDLSSFEIGKTTDTFGMLSYLLELRTIYTPKIMDVENSIFLPNIFYDEEKSRVDELTVDNCNKVIKIDTSEAFGTHFGFLWSYDKGTKTITVTGEDSGLDYLCSVLPETVKNNVKKVIFKDCIVSDSLFKVLTELNGLESVEFDNFDTGNVTNMCAMFFECRSLKSVDASGFDTSNVADMSYMFCGCNNLKSVNISGFDTSNVTNMSYMFWGCNSLNILDLSSFDITNVESTEAMLFDCSNLQTIKTPKKMAKGQGFELPHVFRDSAKNEVTAITSKYCNQTLKKGAESIKYTIDFAGNGSTSGRMNKLSNWEFGTSYKLPSNAYKRTGYTFAGWNTKKNGKGKTYKDKASVKNLTSTNGKTITLYAQWTPNKYNIKFNKNGATSGTMKDMTNRKFGTSYKLTANKFKRKGYTFTGWNTKKNGKGKTYKDKASVKNLTTANNKTITLYAQWKKESYKITYKLNGGKNVKANPAKYDITTKTITLKAPTKKGYVFKGWYSDSKYKKKVSKIAKGSTGNVTLYAKWAKK